MGLEKRNTKVPEKRIWKTETEGACRHCFSETMAPKNG